MKEKGISCTPGRNLKTEYRYIRHLRPELFNRATMTI